jgi:ribosomal protein L21
VLTIHHVSDQGSFWGLDFKLTNLPEQFFTLYGVEFFGRLNFLKGGILYADRITTVSEHYGREIQTLSGGCGLDGVLRENAPRLSAILDGADYTRWNPASDRLLPGRYDARRLRGKQVCREALLKEMKLASAPRGPVFGMVTRVVQEKGFEILVPLLDRLLWDDVRLIILGEGDPAYEIALAVAARKFPTGFAYQKNYDDKLAHLIEAGMDISLIPSRLPPVWAMYKNIYPGSLRQVEPGDHRGLRSDNDSGYGFLLRVFKRGFRDAIKRARQIFRPTPWTKLMKQAMAQFRDVRAAAKIFTSNWATAGRSGRFIPSAGTLKELSVSRAGPGLEFWAAFSSPNPMAYAIIKTGGRQFRVAEGDTIDVDVLEAEAGKTATFGDVLMFADGDNVTQGDPLISGAKVTGEVLEQRKDKKVIAFKYKRRKGYHRTVGHRRKLTRVKIKSISLGAKKGPAKKTEE